MPTASIRINGSPTPVTNISIGGTVTLTNNNNAGVTTWAWSLLDIPSGSAATLSAPTSATTTFVADKEGSYNIRLSVNSDASVATAIAAVLTVHMADRLPAAQERTEVSVSKGWSDAVNTLLGKHERGLRLGSTISAAASIAIPIGTPVYVSGETTLSNSDKVPLVAKALATGTSTLPVIGVATTATTGGSTQRLDVRVLGGLTEYAVNTVGRAVGDSVYLSNTGTLVFTPGLIPFVVGYVETVGATGRIFIRPEASKQSLITTDNITLYVATTGNDSNDGLSAGSPLLTIQAAVNKIPQIVVHAVVINVAAGTYGAGAKISNIVVGDGTFTIKGTLITSTLATGTATGTATSGTAGSGSTFGTMDDSGQTWTSSDLRGKIVHITSGAGVTQRAVITRNSATSITIAGVWSVTVDATSGYTIEEPGTILNGDIGTGSAFYVNGTAMSFQNISFVTGSAISFLKLVGQANVMMSMCHIDTADDYGIRVSDVLPGIYLAVTKCTGTADTAYILMSGAAHEVVCDHGAIDDGYMDVEMGHVESSSTSVVSSALRPCVSVTATDVATFTNEAYSGGTYGVWSDSGYCKIDGCSFSSHTTAAVASLYDSRIAMVNTNGGLGNAIGILLQEGGRVRISSGTAVPGSTTEIQMDGVNYSYDEFHSLSPKRIVDASSLSKLYEA